MATPRQQKKAAAITASTLPVGATFMDPRGTEERKEAFLAALAESYTATTAAEKAGIDRATPYRWRAADEAFARRWDAALEAGRRMTGALVEDKLLDQALSGNTLAGFFIAKRVDPAYRDNYKPEPSGHQQRHQGGEEALSISAWRAMLAELGMGEAIGIVPDEALPLLPEHAGGDEGS